MHICHKYKTANLRAFMGLPILHTYDLCAVSAMTLRDIRAPASSPDGSLRIAVFFVFMLFYIKSKRTRMSALAFYLDIYLTP